MSENKAVEIPQPLRVLFLEDTPSDVELAVMELRRAGYAPEWECVETEEAFLEKLQGDFDIILSDYSMPQFDGIRALRLVRGQGVQIPFILVSGTMGEETAVAAMKEGASDYLLKDRLARLGPAVAQALEQSKLRREREQTEERLREQADIINRAQDAIIVRDFATDRITIWNTGAERLYGWSPSEALGRPLAELIFNELDTRATLLENLVTTGEFHGEIKHRTKDGREVIVHTRASLIRNDDGTPRSVLGINTDITEQKKLETQLLRAQRLESIGTLASGVAHDLNNILAPILMGSAILRRSEMPPEDDAILSTIETCAQRGADIVRQVLTFARGAEGERLQLQAALLIKDVGKIADETFPKKIRIRARFSESVWTVLGDPTQLHQVLLNLCVNARDAMPAGGVLTLSVENFPVDEHYASMTPGAKAGPHVCFEIADTGMGIPPQNIDKIFDPFFTTKALGHGTGLGLSSVIGIVKSHGGFMTVESEIGRGTTFKVYLPAKIGKLETLKETPPADFPRAQGELLLLVDDEKPILQIAQALLEGHGYRILTAAEVPEALAIFAIHKDEIKLVLTDLQMPLMDGITLIRTFKKMKPDVRIIASTGRGEQEQHAEELQELKVAACLPKPYSRNNLLQTLQHALNQKEDKS